MALFYDYAVDLPSNTRQICSSWNEAETILAVALDNREVHFFSDEGEKVQIPPHSRKSDITSIAWQPRGNVLAVTWSDGMLSLWVQKENTAREVNSPHTSRIGLLKWAPTGNRLITGDESGVLAVWKIDARGQISLCTQYTRQGAITQCVFCTISSRRDKEPKSDSSFATAACPSFFFGGDLGSVHYADDLGHISDVQTLNHAIDCMMFYEEKHRLIVITRSSQLLQLQVASDGTVKPIMKVKLSVSGDGGLKEAIWAGPGLMATASGEPLIRFWDLQKEENYVLSLASSGVPPSDRVSAIDFNPRKRILAAGTNEGKIIFWRLGGSKTTQWNLLAIADMRQSVSKIGWNPNFSFIYANGQLSGVTIFHEAVMNRSMNGDTAVIQTRPMALSIEKLHEGTVAQTSIDASIRIKGLAHDGNLILVWNGSKAEVYELQSDLETKRLSTFKCTSNAMQLRGDAIYRTHGNHIEITNTSGTVKNTISFTEAEGKPYLLHVNNKYLAVGTDAGLIRVFDLSRREPKAFGSLGNITKSMEGIDEKSILRSLRVNCDGTRVSFLLYSIQGGLKMSVPHTKLYLFNTDLNIFQSFEFGPSRHPTSHFWDPQEPRLIACETYQDKLIDELKNLNGDEKDPTRLHSHAEKEITILFTSNENGILMQDNFDLDIKYNGLLGIHVPRMYLSSNNDIKNNNSIPIALLRTKIMRDFVGLDKVDDTSRQALIDFSYYMTIGNMDEAYRSVKLIQNASVWENMAHMCVKTKRLDVAQVCLGNMGHARGAAAVNDSKLNSNHIQVPIAMVAIQLGLLDDAARLYKECDRFDLLNKLYQSAGYWTKAIEVATKRDRIHLKTTHFSYAKHLEEEGNIKEAIKHYEEAGTGSKDIPRMLFSLGKLDMLNSYASKSDDVKFQLWWAQYQESNQQYDAAIASYKRAKDYLSIVRVLCHKNEYEQAAAVVTSTNNRAAAYHLARQYESIDKIPNAIQFYAQSSCYNHAIRLSREYNYDGELMNYALLSKPNSMVECAQYFEIKNEFEKSVILYSKSGHITKAIEICFHAKLYDELERISDELNISTTTSSVVLIKCADFFIKNKQYHKAVPLLLRGNRIEDALDICIKNKIKITDEMAEELTPLKINDENDKIKKRNELLMKLAKCCKHQGSYHLATKKYTQAGAKLKAMKCLLKSGDTEKIIFFANVSRNNEIYILGANYLQSLNWQNENEIFKNIIQFYTKGKGYEQLITFYNSCAQIEIDENKNYEKAKNYLLNGIKIITKFINEKKDEKINLFQQRIYYIEQFLKAKEIGQNDKNEMIQQLEKLLNENDIDLAVRYGDIISILISYSCENQEYQQANEFIQFMRQKNINIKSYISQKLLNDIQNKCENLPEKKRNEKKGDEEEKGDEMEEDIEEEASPPRRK